MAAGDDESVIDEGGEGQETAADRFDQLWRNRNNQTTQKDNQDARVAPDVPSQHLGTKVQGSYTETEELQGAAANDIVEIDGQPAREQERVEIGDVDGAASERSGSSRSAVEHSAHSEGLHQAATFDPGEGLSFDALDRGGFERSPFNSGIDSDLVAAGDDATDGSAVDAEQTLDSDGAEGALGLMPPSAEPQESEIESRDGEDSGELPSESGLLVNVAPEDLVLRGGEISENAVAGSVVAQIRPIDANSDDRFTYSLIDDAGGRFAIDADTGEVTVADGAVLDFEAAASHAIQVTVTDAGGLSRTETFTIDLGNVNEGPSDLVLGSGGSVAENAAAGTVVARLVGSDPDAGEVLSYSLA
ncbi:MAG: cadherin repeat domain-containing protein, partial [Pseudomonadota bacterium]